MKYSEETLQAWTAPLSSSEEQRAENTIKMILSAIDNSDELKTKDIEVFIQGSFANNTNVRAESDVDVCVMLKDTFHFDLPDGKTRQDYGFTPASITFFDYRDMVKRALQQKFKTEYVSDGNKSLKIDENTYHVKADVVPAFQLRNYYYWKSTDPNRYIEGTWFMSKNGKEIKNYPKEHIRTFVSDWQGENKKYDGSLDIKQSFLNVSIAFKTGESRSFSVLSSIETEGDWKKIVYIYQNEPKAELADRSSIHKGTAELWIEESGELTGNYYTSRNTRGSMNFKPITSKSSGSNAEQE